MSSRRSCKVFAGAGLSGRSIGNVERAHLSRFQCNRTAAAGGARRNGRRVDCVGNASSVHQPGREARALMEAARRAVAALAGAPAAGLVFTSGGTEAARTLTPSLRIGREHATSICCWFRPASTPACFRAIGSRAEQVVVLPLQPTGGGLGRSEAASAGEPGKAAASGAAGREQRDGCDSARRRGGCKGAGGGRRDGLRCGSGVWPDPVHR